jgi:phenylalanyl-tRNA synthetase alpha subunit
MEQLDQLVQQAAAEFAAAADGAQLEQAKARYLGKAGALTERLKALGKLEPEARREAGAAINAAKTAIEAALEAAATRCAKPRCSPSSPPRRSTSPCPGAVASRAACTR